MDDAAGQAKWIKERLGDVELGVPRNERDESRWSRTVNWRASELGDGIAKVPAGSGQLFVVSEGQQQARQGAVYHPPEFRRASGKKGSGRHFNSLPYLSVGTR